MIVASTIVGLACSACGPKVANSPSLNTDTGHEDDSNTAWATRVLDEQERHEVTDAIRSSAGDRTAAEVGPGPRPAPRGRWIDLPSAVASAGARVGVAVVSTRFDPPDTQSADADAIEFELMTLADEPGRLRVERRPPPEVYAATIVEIGLFRQRREIASRLLVEVEEELLKWGRKPRLAPIDPRPASKSPSE